jgi:hypothetical protein
VVTLAVIQAYPLFYGKYTWNTGSIEIAYIIQAKTLYENFPLTGWNPAWYGGYPFKLSYPPAFLYIVCLASTLVGGDVAEAYRRVTFTTLILLPLAIYFFMYSLSRSNTTGFLSSIVYLSTPSLHRLIYTYPAVPPYPDHVTLIGLYGETPHLLGLTLAIITSTLFQQYIESHRRIFWITMTFMIALVNLVNFIAAVSLLIILFSQAILSDWNSFKKFVTSYILGSGLCLFVYDLEYLNALISYGRLTMQRYVLTIPHAVLIILILSLGYGLARYLKSKTYRGALSTTLLLTVIFLLIVLFNRFLRIELLPQAIRYNPEFDISFYSLSTTIITAVLSKFKKYGKTIITVLIVIAFYLYVQGLPHAWVMLRMGDQEITNSLEMNVTKFIDTLPGDMFAPRVYATGSIAFWLNMFTDKPQVRGGFDEVSGSINSMWAHISYFVNKNSNTTLSALWLEAFNVRYIIVDFPSAKLPYKDYEYPEKFENKLNLVKEIDGVVIYEVLLKNPGLLQLVRKVEDIPLLTRIDDLYGLMNYLKLVREEECNAVLEYKVVSRNMIEVKIDGLKEDCLLLFKVNYDSRWRAYIDGYELAPHKIGPGFTYYDLTGIKDTARIKLEYKMLEFIDILFDILSVVFLLATVYYYFKRLRR